MVEDGTGPDGRSAELRRLLDLLATDLVAGFEELVRTYQWIIYSTLLRACAHPFDAEDLTAQTFLRAYTALLNYHPDRVRELQPRAWLVTIALNGWRNTARDRTRRPSQVPLDQANDLPAPGDAVEQVAERNEERRRLVELVAELSEAQRIAVVLRYVCEFSIVEIAEVLNCPAGTVKSHIFRGLRRLRAGYPPSAGSAPADSTALPDVARIPLPVGTDRRPPA